MDTERFKQMWVDRLHRPRGATTQTSYRLPNYLQAQIDVICELYPNVSRTSVVSDLLDEAIRDFESKLPSNPESVRRGIPPQKDGLRTQFRALSNTYFEKLDKFAKYDLIFHSLIPVTPDLSEEPEQ